MWGHYGFKVMGIYSRPLNGVSCSITNFLWWCRPFIYGGCAPSTFLGSWVLVVPYLCSRFCIFDRPVLEEYVYQVEGGPHLLQSCFHVIQDNFPPTIKNMNFYFESLEITNALSLHESLMDIYHNTSFRSILEEISISSTFKAHICFCLGKGAALWLIIRPPICSFHITHSIFISMLCFHLKLI